MNATISNKEHPDWGCATIPLPIPDEEYAHCMELLEQLGIGGVTERDCHLDRIDRSPAALDVLEGQEVNIDELDFLARSIERYWGNEQPKFEAMAYKLGLKDVPSLINLSFGCERTTILTSFDDLNAAGKDHYMDTHGGCAPTSVLDSLDGEKLIRDLIATGAGTVTPSGVVFDNGFQLEPHYTGRNFPVYYDKQYLMEMELAPLESEPEDAPLTLLLPTPEKRLERLLERGGYRTAEDVQIRTWRSELPDQINDRLNIPHESVTELNRMFQAVETLKGPGMDRLAAAVLMAQPEYASQVRHLAENLDLFEFVPNIRTPEELGRFMIQQSGHFEYDPNLDGFYDYAKYGEQRVREQAGAFNELGYQYKSFVGYRKGLNGEPEIDEEQAVIVRRIFARYLMGDSVSQICKGLEADGIKTVRGNEKWTDGAIRGMLQNEKYIGDALLQKTYIADIFTHQAKKNMGELPKYYVHDCHPAIIDRETFRKVQEEMARRSGKRRTSSKAKTELGKYSGKYALSELLVCGECGSPYRRQTYMPRGEKYYVWRCLNRMENGTRICKNSPTFKERELQVAVIAAINEMFSQQKAKDAARDSVVAALAAEAPTLSLPAIENQLRTVQDRQMELMRLALNAGVDNTAYDDELQKIYAAKAQLMMLKEEMDHAEQMQTEYDDRMERIDTALELDSGAIAEYDEIMVRQLISNIKVLDAETILVRFKDGTEITQRID